jgi:rhamnogalacturonyl hydrolase YesR
MYFKRILPLLLLAATAATAAAQTPQKAPQQQDILRAMRLANTYFMQKWPDPGQQIVTNIARPSNIWTRAVYYEGLMALYSIDPKKEYYDYAVDWGQKHQWLPRNFLKNPNADDQCCGQTWIDLYGIDPRIERIGAIKATIDKMIHSDKVDDWTWIDALQMAMPVFARLGVLYKDSSYFQKMYELYHQTKTVQGGHGLYNSEEHLWWRDKDFTPPYKEPNGQNCYWSRGNGWVLAALARVLSILPVGDAHRAEYLQNYLDMVSALVPLQRADGFWNVSLHDSTHFGGKEVTGTALFTYGIAWGIREGWLDKKVYEPVVIKAWNGLVRDALHPDGMLGYVQGTGKEPKDGQPVSYDKIPDFEDFGLGCFLLAGSEVYQIATPPEANLDESKVPPYQEPALRLTTMSDWHNSQSGAIFSLFEKNVYGRVPLTPLPETFTTESVDDKALGGIATRKEITIHFSSADTAARLHVALYLPNGIPRAPIFVGYSFTPLNTIEGSPQWPLKAILSRGYGVAVAWYWDIEPDRPDGWQTGIRTRLASLLKIEPYEWSAIGAWAWGLMSIGNYLEREKRVDTRRLIVIGHSRLGKTALWAGAFDSRFAMVISNESGEGGAALSKRDYGETIAIINDKFPWWFVPAYKQYGSNTAAMPFDQFMLLALIAPRPLYVASAEGDQWSDPRGEFLSAHLATRVYHLFNEKGIETDSMPAPEHPVGDGYIRYHIRSGKHDITLYDWQQYMDFADRRLPGKGHIK